MKVKLFREKPIKLEEVINEWLESLNGNIEILQICMTETGRQPAEKITLLLLYTETVLICEPDFESMKIALDSKNMVDNVFEVK